MESQERLQEIVRKYYLEILGRDPDEIGLNYFISQLENRNIKTEDMPSILKNSDEYKFSHPTNLNTDTISVYERMKTDWDARADMDVLFSIRSVKGQSEEEFWQSGKDDCNSILGVNTPRYEYIVKNNDPKKMKVLEIGCGIGRILIPMAKKFGNVLGVDISTEMVKASKSYIKKIQNCEIFENKGSDLSMFVDDSFDFCYSFIVFQHIPDKEIIKNYISEVSRVLKSGSVFRFQVRGEVNNKPREITTWDGVQFSPKEMHDLADKNKFEILEESGQNTEYYWLTYRSVK